MAESNLKLRERVREWEIDLIVHWAATNYQDAFINELIGAIGQTVPLALPYHDADLSDIVLHKSEGVGTAWGENDIRCTLTSGEKTLVLLIETKIDAQFTENQPQRYRERCEQLRLLEDVDDAFCILLAPDRYTNANAGVFDARIGFELVDNILASLPRVPDLDFLRGTYRDVVKRAAHQTYEQMTDPLVGDFWDNYRKLVDRHFRSLRLKTSKGGSRWSKDVYFEQPAQGWNIKHRLDDKAASVVIELYGWGPLIEVVRQEVDGKMISGMSIHHPPSGRKKDGTPHSLHLSAPVPNTNPLNPFEEQIDAVMKGLQTVEEIMTWVQNNHELVERLNSVYRAHKR